MARTVAELMTREPATVREQDTVARAAQLMRQNDTGNVAVVEDGHLVGIITDRDIAVRVVAADRPASTPVGEAASHEELAVISPETTIQQAASVMREKSVRRLPVVRDDQLLGIVSLGDLAIEADPESGLADVSAAKPNP
ncbi:CBS domain-containing protein [Streptomyces sp. URMC 129]|uniref:CBS domain-containing protein n=1 Tax=Streptomyces sp. URMC 129 TaxID=3423407 RepID=UPI003F1C4BF0